MATIYRDMNAQLKTCPYNSAHKVKASKFQCHVSNCAVQNALTPLRECPFNATHRLPKEEYEEHLISCPDNRRFMRNVFVAKAEKIEVKEDEEDYRMKGKDIWSDQYIDNSTSKNYEVLSDSNVTAEWLFARRFGVRGDTTFIDTLFVQRMSYEERKKYQLMCVQEIKRMNSNEEEDIQLIVDQNLTEQQLNSEIIGPLIDPDFQVVDVRRPNIQNPFAKGVNDSRVKSDPQTYESYRGAGLGRGYRSKRVSYQRDNRR